MDDQTRSRRDGDRPRHDQGLASAELPDGFVLVRTWTLGTTQELSDFRASLRTEVARGVRPEPDLDVIAANMVLVASELATNALKHGIPPTIVRLLRAEDTYILDVADHDLGGAPLLAGARAPGEGGYGLQIARRIAQEVGWYTAEVTKHVWARFPVHATAAGS